MSPFVVLSVLVSLAAAADWHYYEPISPPEWYINYPKCALTHQSPIDIPVNDVVYADLGEINFVGYDQAPAGSVMTVVNNGHDVEVTVRGEDITMSGGGFDGTYRLDEFHFHWGSDSSKGSEHTVGGRSFPMEMHMVHYNTRYATIEEADDGDDHSIAVLGFLFEVQAEDNPAFEELVNHLSQVPYEGDSVEVTPYSLMPMLPSDLSLFYRYSGSFTTPPCYESVVWTEFQNTIGISERQLEQFRGLYFGHQDGSHRPLVDNNRPTQDLHGRTVYSTNPADQ